MSALIIPNTLIHCPRFILTHPARRGTTHSSNFSNYLECIVKIRTSAHLGEKFIVMTFLLFHMSEIVPVAIVATNAGTLNICFANGTME